MASTTIQPGLLLQNRYQVVRFLGGGGFGHIFEVEDGGTAKVLKVLNPQHFNNPSIKQKAIALFQREAEFLSQVEHPGIPRVEPQAYFTWPEGASEPLHCLVMEKIVGLNLQEWMRSNRNQPITTEIACDWLIQLINILNLLHKQQYFHRDIKPSNIMRRPDGQLVLIDFGAVREVTESYLQQQRGNETGTVIISAGYTPPEQAEGRAVTQSDFFALARTFVYLLTGKLPIDFPKHPDTGELIWRDKAAQISPRLADLIDWMMATFPGQRPKNAGEILQQIERIQKNSQSILVKFAETLPGISSLISKRFRLQDRIIIRYKRSLQLALSSLLLLGGTTLWKSSPAIADYLNSQGYTNYRQGQKSTAEFYYRSALFFDSKMPEPKYNLGLIYEDSQEPHKARDFYKAAVQEGLDIAFNNLARLDILDGRYASAISLLQKGLPLAEDDKAEYAMLKNIGWAQFKLGRYQEAKTHLDKAIGVQDNKAAAYCLKAQVLERQNRPQEALPDWGNCIKYFKLETPEEKEWINTALGKVRESIPSVVSQQKLRSN